MKKSEIYTLIFIQIAFLFILFNTAFSTNQVQVNNNIPEKTITEIIISNPGILTGLAALITAIAAIWINKKKLSKKDLPEEITRSIQEKEFREKLILNLIDRDMMEKIIKNGDLITTKKLDEFIVDKLKSFNAMKDENIRLLETLIKHERELRETEIKRIDQ